MLLAVSFSLSREESVMSKAFLCVLVCASAMVAVGACSVGEQAPSDKEFANLYKQFSTRFHDKMVKEGDTVKPEQIPAEAARVWDEVFGTHKDVLKRRVEEILKDLDAAPLIVESPEKVDGQRAYTVGGTVYVEIASIGRATGDDPAKSGALKHLLWNPLSAAQITLNNWLSTILPQKTISIRSMTTSQASLIWQAIDKSIDRPRLVLTQGPMLYVVDLQRIDDFYVVDKMRWLRPKGMGSVLISEQPSVRPPEKAPEKAPEKPAEKPATPAE
jgi:hypothetical protein